MKDAFQNRIAPYVRLRELAAGEAPAERTLCSLRAVLEGAALGTLAERFSLTEGEALLAGCLAGLAGEEERLAVTGYCLGMEGDFSPPLFSFEEGGAKLHPAARAFLMGNPVLPEGTRLIQGGAPLLHHRVLAAELAALLETIAAGKAGRPTAIALCGREGSGRGFLCAEAARRAGALLAAADCRALTPQAAGALTVAAPLLGALVCLTHFTARDLPLLEQLSGTLPAVFLLTERRELEALRPEGFALFAREVGGLTQGERLEALVWALEGFAAEKGSVLETAAGPARLDMGRIAALRAALEAETLLTGGKVSARLLGRLLPRERAPEGARELRGRAGLDALVLPEPQMRQLRDFCAFTRARGAVWEEWGFGEKVPYGRGLSALFYGASGTGKTLAARAVAGELGLPLWRVDLSQLISKYIGETQKNIGKVFDGAAAAGGILFFDEADALFSRRGEVSDSQDKYANAEIAYLLQRMEEYDGPVLLATNLLQNFDEAFRRRISFMVAFPLPDARGREALWRGVFPAGAPLGAVDFPLLARQFELSGAGIKNCALGAAYRAAAAGSAIGMPEILAAVRDEYAKLGRAPGPQAARMLEEGGERI